MRIKTLSVTYERKINTGNYSSATLGLTLWADRDEGEDIDEAIAALQAKARSAVKAEYSRIESRTQAQEHSS